MQERESRFDIHPESSSVFEPVTVLKHGDTFGVFDRFGDVHGAQGLFHEDTRYLSRLFLGIGNQRPLLLGSTTQRSDTTLVVNMTNSEVMLAPDDVLAGGSIHLKRHKFLWHGVCYEELTVYNYGLRRVTVPLRLLFDADFADIFEVRGTPRKRHGTRHGPLRDGDSLVVRYEGLDGRERLARLSFSEPPAVQRGGDVEFRFTLSPSEQTTLYFTCACESPGTARTPSTCRASYQRASEGLSAHEATSRAEHCQIVTSSVRFNEWMERCVSDLHMLVGDTEHGPYPYAGVPWFSTPFGRDGIITALECLWVRPSLARGVLRFLAATQSTTTDPARVAEPGKILHESRKGEMANLNEVPFGRYYGSVDATPLFVMLAGAYYEHTADRALIEEIWPNLELALGWIDARIAADPNGFLCYESDPNGLRHQGWKDSSDSVFRTDGSEPEGTIALCEVQAYAYAAYRAASELARMLEKDAQATRFEAAAAELAARFEQAFWCDELDTYALALDGTLSRCSVRASNAGHCLFARIAAPERAARVMHTLMAPNSFSGWGIRTVAAGEARYNPMSYHNGSVWPHDNALIAAGFAHYGFRQEALQLLLGLYDATLFFDTRRLPELFCGFDRDRHGVPIVYPAACSLQAWASAAPFMLLRSCLGMTIDAPRRRLVFDNAVLPSFLTELRINNLRVGQDTVDLILHRYPEDVGINVLKRSGPIEVINVK